MDAERIFDDLVRLETRGWNHLDARMRRGGGPSLGTYKVLQLIATIDPCRVQDVAATLEISVGGASQAVDRVAAKGWCLRAPNPHDRRSSVLELTEAGRDVLSRNRSVLEEGLLEFFAGLDGPGLTEFGRILAELRSAQTTSTLRTEE